MSVRGTSSSHRVPLRETVFATDDLEWSDPKPWPLWVTVPLVAIASGICWAAVIIFILAVKEAFQ